MLMVSNRMPKNSSTCEGPCVFPGAIGILMFSKVDTIFVKLC